MPSTVRIILSPVNRTISQAEFGQADKEHDLTAWQRQWDASEKGSSNPLWPDAKSNNENNV